MKCSRRICGSLVAAALGTAAVGSTAQAEVIGGSVPANHNVTIFHNIDMIAVFGGPAATPTTVEAFRNGTRIGYASGNSADIGEFDAPNNGGMEVNHGPEGAPVAGDCWENFTPDIMAGDVVRITGAGVATPQEVRVDDIEIYGNAFAGPNGEIHVQGHAALADGTPIPIADLDSGELRQADPRYRANPSRVIRTPGTTSGWTMIYDPPYTPFVEESGGLSQQERRDALLNNEHAMGYGHIAPPPLETQLSDGLEASGPALGCEASGGQSNAVDGADDTAINATSGDLLVNGRSMAGGVDGAGALDAGTDITGATITASDGTNSVTAPAAGDFDGPGAWNATFTRAQLDTLADGPIAVTGSWTGAGPAIGGQKLELTKDVVAPVLAATPSPGTSTAPTSVALSAGPGETITYRTDGAPQTNNDLAYTGPIALSVGTNVLSVRVRDAAGNVTDETLTYTVNAPASPPPAASGGSSSPAPIVRPPVQQILAPSLNAPALVATAQRSLRLRLATVKRRGLSAAFTAPAGATTAQARLFRVKRGRRTRVSSKSMQVVAGRNTVRFAGRRLKAGRYALVLRVGRDASSLGKATTITVTVVR